MVRHTASSYNNGKKKGVFIMKSILKSLREEAGLTQEQVANLADVSVNSIQNWERSEKIQSDSLHLLLDIYNVDKPTRDRIVLEFFGRHEDSETNPIDNFPYFLFQDRPDIIDAVKRAELSAEEVELLGYVRYANFRRSGCSGFMDYSDFKIFGGYFNTMKAVENIKDKIGDFLEISRYSESTSLFDRVYNYGLRHPNSPFSFVRQSKCDIIANIQNLPVYKKKEDRIDISDLYDLCSTARACVELGSGEYTCNEAVQSFRKILILKESHRGYQYRKYDYKLDEDSFFARCFVIKKVENSDSDYLERKKQYLADKAAYDEHPLLFDKAPEFCFEFTAFLELNNLGWKFIEWYES